MIEDKFWQLFEFFILSKNLIDVHFDEWEIIDEGERFSLVTLLICQCAVNWIDKDNSNAHGNNHTIQLWYRLFVVEKITKLPSMLSVNTRLVKYLLLSCVLYYSIKYVFRSRAEESVTKGNSSCTLSMCIRLCRSFLGIDWCTCWSILW